MNNKLIAASAAVVALALVFAGIGYAAYSATLIDNETVTADNNFVTLTLGTSTELKQDVDLVYESTTTYTNGASPTYVYKPYLVMDPMMPIADDEIGKASLGAIQVKADISEIGAENASTTYKLTIGDFEMTSGEHPAQLTGVEVKAFTDAALTTPTTSLDALAYDTVYYLGLVYEHDDTDNTTEAPSSTMTFKYELTAEANIVAA